MVAFLSSVANIPISPSAPQNPTFKSVENSPTGSQDLSSSNLFSAQGVLTGVADADVVGNGDREDGEIEEGEISEGNESEPIQQTVGTAVTEAVSVGQKRKHDQIEPSGQTEGANMNRRKKKKNKGMKKKQRQMHRTSIDASVKSEMPSASIHQQQHQQQRQQQPSSEPPLKKSDLPCTFWASNSCVKGTACEFSHAGPGSDPRTQTLCRYFRAGQCRLGDSCPYSHDTKQELCAFYHFKGRCEKGDLCRFWHGEVSEEMFGRWQREQDRFEKFSEGKKEESERRELEGKMWFGERESAWGNEWEGVGASAGGVGGGAAVGGWGHGEVKGDGQSGFSGKVKAEGGGMSALPSSVGWDQGWDSGGLRPSPWGTAGNGNGFGQRMKQEEGKVLDGQIKREDKSVVGNMLFGQGRVKFTQHQKFGTATSARIKREEG
ncbi:hypothetical protein HDV00_006272 [Rhizophlyctis rosea]|nr:hypothetical protein HDV00_006272 [Rhizophlyctis rosea]